MPRHRVLFSVSDQVWTRAAAALGGRLAHRIAGDDANPVVGGIIIARSAVPNARRWTVRWTYTDPDGAQQTLETEVSTRMLFHTEDEARSHSTRAGGARRRQVHSPPPPSPSNADTAAASPAEENQNNGDAA